MPRSLLALKLDLGLELFDLSRHLILYNIICLRYNFSISHSISRYKNIGESEIFEYSFQGDLEYSQNRIHWTPRVRSILYPPVYLPFFFFLAIDTPK